jgi:cytidylate kinase
MTQEQPFVISISRQMGSGGPYVGQQLAAKLQVAYVDREIINKAAQQLQVSETDIESRDETITPLWREILITSPYINPSLYVPPPICEPTDKELYQTESEIIDQISKNFSAVIVGRGGSFLLKDHPRHMSVFLHAAMPFRIKRVKMLYNLSEEKARKFIDSSDKARSIYLKAITGRDWIDVRQYQLSIDTSLTGLDGAVEVILAAIRVRFGDVCAKVK